VQLVEQPLLKTNLDDHFKLKQLQILPLFADESFKRLSQLEDVKDCFDGVNIKLMKCTGINEASKIIKHARLNNLKIMIGCMSESSCAIRAAMALAPLCDYADLDGPFLINNNPFDEIELKEGKLQLNDEPGIGVRELGSKLIKVV
jgi:L-alanine-DL-glutamate epimerase-like enolase superfamily enzyme